MRKKRRLKNKSALHKFTLNRIVDKIIDEILVEEMQSKADRAKAALKG